MAPYDRASEQLKWEAKGLFRWAGYLERFSKSLCCVRAECCCIHELWMVSAVQAVLYRPERSLVTKTIPWIIAYRKDIRWRSWGLFCWWKWRLHNFRALLCHMCSNLQGCFPLRKTRAVPCTRCSWVCPGLGFFRLGSSRCAITVAVTKLRGVVRFLQLPKWEVFFSILLLGFKPLLKSVQQKAKQASCSDTEKGYAHSPLWWSV